jgi:urease accessory protein
MDNYLLSLLQLCDSNLPTGAFSHSFGLESYIQEELVHSRTSFSKWMEVLIREQLTYSDGLACRLAYEALEDKRLEEIWKLDEMLIAQILAQESREGSRRIGERLLTLGNQLYPSLPLSAYMERVKSRKCNSHPALAFVMIAHGLNIPKSTTVLSYLFSTVTSLIQNAVRGIPLGQTDGQQLIKESNFYIKESWNVIQKLTEEDFGITPPGLEISQMRHERLHIRIFMS